MPKTALTPEERQFLEKIRAESWQQVIHCLPDEVLINEGQVCRRCGDTIIVASGGAVPYDSCFVRGNKFQKLKPGLRWCTE